MLWSQSKIQHVNLKLIIYEQEGFTIFYRRLEKGAFEVPDFDR